jgi:hypothetical protein
VGEQFAEVGGLRVIVAMDPLGTIARFFLEAMTGTSEQ